MESGSLKPGRCAVRMATDEDLAAITAIYAHHVRHGTGTFELEPPSRTEMASRIAAVRHNGWPWLVAIRDQQVLGYAYANIYRPRPAYRFSVEDSIYIEPGCQRDGVGRALLAELIARCEAGGARQMIAVIGDSANLGSIGLHAALGFMPAGNLRDTGWKFDRWLDTVLMQRTLGEGAAQPPRTV